MRKVGYKGLVEAAEERIRIISATEAIGKLSEDDVFFCNLGWRSALAADIAQQMGLNTCHIDGGFEAWKTAGGEVRTGR